MGRTLKAQPATWRSSVGVGLVWQCESPIVTRSDTWLGRVNMMVGNGAKDTRDRKQTSWKKS